MAAIGDLVATLGIDRRKFTSGITQAQRDLMKFGTTSSVSLSRFSTSVTRAMGPIVQFRATTATMFLPFQSALVAAERGIIGFGAVVVKTASTVVAAAASMTAAFLPLTGAFALFAAARGGEMFEQAMHRSLAIIKDVSAAMRSTMVNTAYAVAKATKFAAHEVAEAYYFLASAHLNVKQSLAALPQVTAFAQAGMFDLATATELATDAQAALGMKSKNAAQNLVNLARVTDVLVAANTMADATTEEFARALTGKAGPALRSVKKSIEEGVAILTVFADQGLKGEEASTRLAMVLRDLRIKAVMNQQAFTKMNIEVFREGKMRHVADIVGDLERSLGGLSDRARTLALLQLGFTFKSMTGIEILMGKSVELRENYEELLGVMGRTQEVAAEQLTPFQKGWAKLSGTFSEIGNVIMKVVGPAFHGLAIFISGLWDSMMKFPANIRYLLGFGDAASDAAEEINKLGGSLEAVAAASTRAAEAQSRHADQIERVRISIKEAKEQMDAYKKSIEANQSALDAIKGKAFDIKTYGMSDFQKEAEKMRDAFVDPATIEEFLKKAKELAALREKTKKGDADERDERAVATAREAADARSKSTADAIRRSLETPLETYRRELEEIAGLKMVGALGADMAARAREKAFADFEFKTGEKSKIKQQQELPKAMERGSAEAWKKTIQAMYGTGKNKPAEQTAKNTERTAKAVEDLAQRDTAEATIP